MLSNCRCTLHPTPPKPTRSVLQTYRPRRQKKECVAAFGGMKVPGLITSMDDWKEVRLGHRMLHEGWLPEILLRQRLFHKTAKRYPTFSAFHQRHVRPTVRGFSCWYRWDVLPRMPEPTNSQHHSENPVTPSPLPSKALHPLISYRIHFLHVARKDIENGTVKQAFGTVGEYGFVNYIPYSVFPLRERFGAFVGVHLLRQSFAGAVYLLLGRRADQCAMDGTLMATPATREGMLDGLNQKGLLPEPSLFGPLRVLYNTDERKLRTLMSRTKERQLLRVVQYALKHRKLPPRKRERKRTVSCPSRPLCSTAELCPRSSDTTPLFDLLSLPEGVMREHIMRTVLLRVMTRSSLKKMVERLFWMIWNETVSTRIARFGPCTVLPGDIVGIQSYNGPEGGNDVTYHFVCSDEIQQGTYTIYDVVIPVLGTSVSLPRNATSQIIAQICRTYGLSDHSSHPETLKGKEESPEDFHENRESCWDVDHALLERLNTVLGFPVVGSYRPLLRRPLPTTPNATEPHGSSLQWTYDPTHTTPTRPNHAVLDLAVDVALPSDAHPSLFVRELCKCDVNMVAHASGAPHTQSVQGRGTNHPSARGSRLPQISSNVAKKTTPPATRPHLGRLHAPSSEWVQNNRQKKHTAGRALHHARLEHEVFGSIRRAGPRIWDSYRIGRSR